MSKKITLLKKTSKRFLFTGLFLAFISTVALYFYTKHLLKSEIEEELYSTEARVVDAIKKGVIGFSLPPVTEVIVIQHLKNKVLKDTIIYDPSQDEMELFRELSTFKNINGKNYKITVRNLVVESETFLVAIVISNIIILGLTFIFLFYFNTARNLQLWNPFFKNLAQMKHFSLTSKEPIALIDSDILEFSELKNEIELLTNKVKTDYENLKQFSENVSHEMQTPLAIIQAKIDNLINEQGINDKQFVQVTSIQNDIQRLKQLNKKITILTKIDNNQFIHIENVNLSKLINEKIENFQELKQVHLAHNSEKELIIPMDSYLADILVNNLISNAIKHGKKDKEITIYTNKSMMSISNFGEKALVNPESIFLRFYRESNRKHSTGLGLAIVKKICDFYSFTPSYSFNEHQHFFSVHFK
ncbi:sensor histidine kinase [Polaribacter sp.]|uniref:sensor histidine kinase n=1 Tax=Polaribacter sp. TaxID=1920175 RepID=UPI003EF2281F